jgi:hypothetical protein
MPDKLSLPHTRDDEDILGFPEVPGIIAGRGAHVIDQLQRVNGDPHISIFSSFDRIKCNLSLALGRIW